MPKTKQTKHQVTRNNLVYKHAKNLYNDYYIPKIRKQNYDDRNQKMLDFLRGDVDECLAIYDNDCGDYQGSQN